MIVAFASVNDGLSTIQAQMRKASALTNAPMDYADRRWRKLGDEENWTALWKKEKRKHRRVFFWSEVNLFMRGKGCFTTGVSMNITINRCHIFDQKSDKGDTYPSDMR